MLDYQRLSTPGVLAGVLAITSFLPPAPLSGQEPVRERAPAAAAVRAEPVKTDLRVLLGSPGDERRISEHLRHRDRAVVAELGQRLRAGATFEEIRPEWTALVRRAGVTSDEDIDDLTRWVMRESYGVDESEEMADLKLQSSLQKQQQTHRMMSNMQKAAHDAAMNSIRNMK